MLLKTEIQNIYNSQNEKIRSVSDEISRDLFQDINLDTDFVIIISGIRRAGKSTVMRQIIKKNKKKSCFYNFEDSRNANFETTDFIKLKDVLQEENKNSRYFFDEIQNVNNWESFVRTEQDLGQQIVITGSNATLLSRELGTKLTGRYIKYELFPFSFSEFLRFTKQKASDKTFLVYLKKGGMPTYLKENNEYILQQIFLDIVLRDIVVKHNLRNSKTITKLGLYLISNTGKPISYNKLRIVFNIGSTNSVIQYISYFEDSYLLFTIPKFSYSLKKQSVNPKKIYSIDTGISSANSLSFSEDKGRMLENLIFLSLRRKYSDIYYFQEKNECDFIVKYKNSIIKIVQVCYELNDDNYKRETNGLLEAMSFFDLEESYIITIGQKDVIVLEEKKINILPAWEWCLDD